MKWLSLLFAIIMQSFHLYKLDNYKIINKHSKTFFWFSFSWLQRKKYVWSGLILMSVKREKICIHEEKTCFQQSDAFSSYYYLKTKFFFF